MPRIIIVTSEKLQTATEASESTHLRPGREVFSRQHADPSRSQSWEYPFEPWCQSPLESSIVPIPGRLRCHRQPVVLKPKALRVIWEMLYVHYLWTITINYLHFNHAFIFTLWSSHIDVGRVPPIDHILNGKPWVNGCPLTSTWRKLYWYWLVVWKCLEHGFYVPYFSWDDDPLIFFRGVETTNQDIVILNYRILPSGYD